MAEGARPGAPALFWSAAELAANPRQFAAFQWVTGFAEALTVGSPRKPEENANEGHEDAGGASSPAVVNLKFKGWEKGPRNSAANARRVAKAFSAVIPESAKLHLFTMGRETEDPEFDSAAMRMEIPGFGLVSGGVDLVIAKGGGSLRRPPPHNGLTMMDDAQAVIECDFDISAVSRKQLRQLYVKTVLVHLLREKPVPVYLTDLQSGAIRASVLSGPRGVPMVIYERLSSEGFIHELQHGHRKPAMTAKTVSAIRRFKYGWCTAELRTRPPFALDGRAGRHSEGGESVPANPTVQMPASNPGVASVAAPGVATGGALSTNPAVSGEGDSKEAFVTPKKRGRKPRDPSVSPAVTNASPGEAEGNAAAKAKAGGAAPKQRAAPKKMKIEAAASAAPTSANGGKNAAENAPTPSVPAAAATSPTVAPAPKAKAAASRVANTDAKTLESDSDSSDSSSDDSDTEPTPVAKAAGAGAKASQDGAGSSVARRAAAAQDSDSSDSDDSSSDED
ncbi:conserved hypothetical protein [Neospora caninum Liverpool]|uniref:Nuclear factor NF4 n=1 Tax=Neospora caninum (strain Liverpool) TaxID=572307 RepID=F0VES4_NEOCL|nr:conserved hypothetical protein [Neospora caninum Liverpool]CBZ52218.1 conserved hypothetical protein [Neospora caninum Liverpool]CEL66186.1 TPA: nuclear factor NF4 [Neospora caninum Liverpool]|eukprot:XP_003882250.1 conserved hypothetical protein [Neospora caninum Liverpool]